MKRTRAYRRYVRNKTIARKKRICKKIYSSDWYKHDGEYSKGKIHCGCKLCKYTKHFGIPLLYEVKDKEYVRICLKDQYCFKTEEAIKCLKYVEGEKKCLK